MKVTRGEWSTGGAWEGGEGKAVRWRRVNVEEKCQRGEGSEGGKESRILKGGGRGGQHMEVERREYYREVGGEEGSGCGRRG